MEQNTANPMLIVEDEPATLQIIEMSLRAEGIAYLSATSVDDALTIIKRDRISVVLLDWKLDRCGIEVLRLCRSVQPQAFVVVMSAISTDTWDVKAHALSAGADSFLEKPFDAMWIAHVQHFLARQRENWSLVLPSDQHNILTLHEFRRLYICHVTKLLGGSLASAAEKLGIHRHTVAAAIKGEDLSNELTAAAPSSGKDGT